MARKGQYTQCTLPMIVLRGVRAGTGYAPTAAVCPSQTFTGRASSEAHVQGISQSAVQNNQVALVERRVAVAVLEGETCFLSCMRRIPMAYGTALVQH